MARFKVLRIDGAEVGTRAAIVDFAEMEMMPGGVAHSTVNRVRPS